MEANVLKDLAILQNSNVTSEKKNPRRQSVMKSFDPLYSSPMKNVMELKPNMTAFLENSENLLSINRDNEQLEFIINKEELCNDNGKAEGLPQQNKSALDTEADISEVEVGEAIGMLVSLSMVEEESQLEEHFNQTIIVRDNKQAASSNTPCIESQLTSQDIANNENCVPNPAKRDLNLTITVHENCSEEESNQINFVPIKDDEQKALNETFPLVNIVEKKQMQEELNDETIKLVAIEEVELKGASVQTHEMGELKAPSQPYENSKDYERLLCEPNPAKRDMNPTITMCENCSEEELNQPNYITIKDDEQKTLNETFALVNVMEKKQIHASEVATPEKLNNEKLDVVEKVELKEASVQTHEMEEPKAPPQAFDNSKDYEGLLKDYEQQFSRMSTDQGVLRKHLMTLEMAFSDIHEKYERVKGILEGYRNNEGKLKKSLEDANNTISYYKEIKDDFHNRLTDVVVEYNRKITTEISKSKTENGKLTALVKMLDIKVKSLEQALVQKTSECENVMALMAEVTRN